MKKSQNKESIHTPKLTWNYRVIKHSDGTLGIHEVYSTDAGIVRMYSAEPTSIVADNISNLKIMLIDALNKPVLDAKQLPGYVDK